MLPHVQLFYFIILFFSIEFKNMQKDGARQWVQTWPVSELQSNKSYYHLISRETVNQMIKATWIVFQYLTLGIQFLSNTFHGIELFANSSSPPPFPPSQFQILNGQKICFGAKLQRPGRFL